MQRVYPIGTFANIVTAQLARAGPQEQSRAAGPQFRHAEHKLQRAKSADLDRGEVNEGQRTASLPAPEKT